MTEDVVLSTRGLTKTFFEDEVETPVLRSVDLEIRRGEFVALMGPSGSGKSTLLTILGTLRRPTSGTLSIMGEDVVERSQAELTRIRNRYVGFVFQFHHLLPDFTALENVMFPAFPSHGGVRPVLRERAKAILERVDLADRLHFRPGQLSGGQKQRVAVARAMMMRPAIVLADEPTGNLDRETSSRVIDLLHDMRRDESTTFLVCTHDASIAERADRTLHIVDGRLG
jgi:lipoprotein-releasing system ATP-binding protein